MKVLDQWLSFRLTGERPEVDEASIYPFSFQILADNAANAAQIHDWIIWRLNQLPGISRDRLELEQPFATYGLDSIMAIQLVNELAEWLNQPLELAALWDLLTIEALVDHLVTSLPGLEEGEVSDRSTTAVDPGLQIGGEEAERLLNRLEDLSESEIDKLLSILDQDEPVAGG